MQKNKIISASDAIALIGDTDVIATSGFVQSCIPEALHAALEQRYVQSAKPRDLTLIMCAGAGDSKGLGTGRLHHPGLLKRVIAGNLGRRSPKPRGITSFRAITCHKASSRNSTAPVRRGTRVYSQRSAYTPTSIHALTVARSTR